MNELFELLRDKQIIAILDGDTSYEDYEFSDGETIKIKMPYLSGPDLCGLSTRFGLPATYSWGGVNLSRWQYLDNLIAYCIEEGRCSDLLSFLFRKEQFTKMLSGHRAEEIDEAYKCIVSNIVDQINGLLYFGGNELAVIGNNYVMRKIGDKVEVVAPQIKNIDRDYIRSISSRAMQDVDDNNFDSAITKARTLLEETFCYVTSLALNCAVKFLLVRDIILSFFLIDNKSISNSLRFVSGSVLNYDTIIGHTG